MKIFSRIATIISVLVLGAVTAFDYYHGFGWYALISVVLMAVVLTCSFKLGVWKRGKENWFA